MTPARDALLDELRPVAFAIAYRMLGSVAEAEDVVQETLLRVHAALEEDTRLESPRAFAATVATRLSIDVLRSARARRETYVGEWLPEPIVTDPGGDPAAQAELADSLSVAFLAVLERLTPEQRAALLLHDVFDYAYPEVARIVGTSEANARQLAARARRHVAEHRPRFTSSRQQRDALAQRFLAAARDGDLAGLEALLAHDVVLRGDGGGKVPAIARPLQGRSRVAQALSTWFAVGRGAGATVRLTEINGQPGTLLYDPEGRLLGVMALDIADGEIRAVSSIVNPDKIGHVGPTGDMRAMIRRHLDARRARRSAAP